MVAGLPHPVLVPSDNQYMQRVGKEVRRRALQALANYPLLEGASDQSIESLLKSARFSQAPARRAILTEGVLATDIHFVLEGSVRIFHRHDSKSYTPKLLSAPNHVGELPLLAGSGHYAESVESVTPCLIASVPWPLLRELLRSDQGLCWGWLVGLATQFVQTIDADRHTAFVDLSGRVANTLLSYGEGMGEETRDGVFIPVPLSRTLLAQHVVSSKRAVIRVLNSFAERGWIAATGSNFILRNSKSLLRMVLPRRLGMAHDARKALKPMA